MRRRGMIALLKSQKAPRRPEKTMHGSGFWKVMGERDDGNCIVLCRCYHEKDALRTIGILRATKGIEGFVRFFIHTGRIDQGMG